MITLKFPKNRGAVLLDESSPNLIGNKDFLRRLCKLLLSRLGFDDFGFRSCSLQVIAYNNIYFTISLGHVGIGSTSPAQALDIGAGNIKMGFSVVKGSVVTGSITSGVWSGWISLCSGTGYIISATCWENGGPSYPACPIQISGASVNVYQCTNTSSISCTYVCANIR